MESLRNTYDILLKERVSTIRRGLLDTIDTRARLIAIKGSRGVGKTNFLLDFAREYHAGDPDCLYVNINNLFFATEGLFHFAERFHKLGGKTLLLDQAHKYPGWDKELREVYDAFPDLQGSAFTFGILNLISCTGDWLNVKNTVQQVPAGAMIQGSGLHSYWYPKEIMKKQY